MDDYAMGLFLAARRKILSLDPMEPTCLCLALSDVIREDGGDRISHKEMISIFPSFAAAYDGKHFWRGKLVDGDYKCKTGVSECWWYPSQDPSPRIAMIDFLVGK